MLETFPHTRQSASAAAGPREFPRAMASNTLSTNALPPRAAGSTPSSDHAPTARTISTAAGSPAPPATHAAPSASSAARGAARRPRAMRASILRPGCTDVRESSTSSGRAAMSPTPRRPASAGPCAACPLASASARAAASSWPRRSGKMLSTFHSGARRAIAERAPRSCACATREPWAAAAARHRAGTRTGRCSPPRTSCTFCIIE
mmetsp:Transcript_54191/g.171977  ORF Transcript_54191/g.171977 Transcript_54191/m.171977 type:complete len:206 (+) Transcript_54191:187-804(+)